jgi:iron complex transport system substrate-binding protein
VRYERVGSEGRLTVRASFDDGADQYEHRLVSRSIIGPARLEGRTIPLPARRLVCLSSTHVGFLAELGATDRLVGVSRRRHIADRGVLARIDRGEIAEVGDGTPIDQEKLLACRPDLVVTFGVSAKDLEPFAAVQRAGIPVLVIAEYTEDSPLGRAEWIKVFGLLVGEEKLAGEKYAAVASRYQELASKGRSVRDRPTVLLNASFQGVWYMPGGNSYMARLIEDAGGDYLWKEEQSSRVLPLDFEGVLARGRLADYWFNVGFWKTLAEGEANDPRYRHFRAFTQGRVYNHMTHAGEETGTDYFERGAARPDLILSDLLFILHPELLPGHALVWYRPLAAE